MGELVKLIYLASSESLARYLWTRLPAVSKILHRSQGRELGSGLYIAV